MTPIASGEDFTASDIAFQNTTAYGNTDVHVSVISGADNYTYSAGNYTAGVRTYGTNGDTLVPVGAWTGDMSDYDVILVWNGSNRVILQAYIVDKSTVVTPVTITSTTVNVTSGAAVNKEVNDVIFSATGNGLTLETSAVWQVREKGQTEFRNCTANEVFVSGNTYCATVTISVPDELASYVTISNKNDITYTPGNTHGTGTTVTTDTFVMP